MKAVWTFFRNVGFYNSTRRYSPDDQYRLRISMFAILILPQDLQNSYMLLHVWQLGCMSRPFCGTSTQVCSDFTYSFQTFPCLPRSWRPFGLYATAEHVCVSCHQSFFLNGLSNFVCVHIFRILRPVYFNFFPDIILAVQSRTVLRILSLVIRFICDSCLSV